MSVINLNKENFEKEVKESNIPVIIYVWAEWCPSCKIFAPIFKEVSEEYEGKVRFCKLNGGENRELAREVEVLSLPTTLIFDEGKEIARFSDSMSKEELKKEIDKIK